MCEVGNEYICLNDLQEYVYYSKDYGDKRQLGSVGHKEGYSKHDFCSPLCYRRLLVKYFLVLFKLFIL